MGKEHEEIFHWRWYRDGKLGHKNMVNINSLYENANFLNVRRGLVVALAEAGWRLPVRALVWAGRAPSRGSCGDASVRPPASASLASGKHVTSRASTELRSPCSVYSVDPSFSPQVFGISSTQHSYLPVFKGTNEKKEDKSHASWQQSFQISCLLIEVLKDAGHWSKFSKICLRVCEELEQTQD